MPHQGLLKNTKKKKKWVAEGGGIRFRVVDHFWKRLGGESVTWRRPKLKGHHHASKIPSYCSMQGGAEGRGEASDAGICLVMGVHPL